MQEVVRPYKARRPFSHLKGRFEESTLSRRQLQRSVDHVSIEVDGRYERIEVLVSVRSFLRRSPTLLKHGSSPSNPAWAAA